MDKKILFRYMPVYFWTYFVFAMGFTQYVPYLTSLGYNAQQRGLMISGYAVTTIIFQLLLGYLSDKYQKVKTVFIITLMLYAVSLLFLFNIQTKIFILHMLMIAIVGGLCSSNFGLMDSWLFSQGEEVIASYSVIRAIGSLGWATACIIITSIIRICGYSMFGVICLISAVIAGGLIQLSSKKELKQTKRQPIKIKEISSLLKNKDYILVIITLFFLCCATSTSGNAVVDKLMLLGATDTQIGLKWSINAFFEIPLYFIGSRLLRKFGPYKLLFASGIAIVIQHGLFSLANSVTVMLLLCGLQMFTGPLVNLASRMLIYKYSPEHLQSTSLLLGISIYSGLNMMMVPSVGGWISQNYHVNVTLLVVTCLSFIGVLLSIKLLKKNQIT